MRYTVLYFIDLRFFVVVDIKRGIRQTTKQIKLRKNVKILSYHRFQSLSNSEVAITVYRAV